MAKLSAAGSRRRPHTLTCRYAAGLVMEYLNGELDSNVRMALDSHLGGCEDCRAFLATYKQTMDATHVLQYDQMPPGLQERALATIRAKIKKQPRQR